MSEIYRDLREARRIAQEQGERERNSRQRTGWDYYNSSIQSYEDSFRDVVPTSIQDSIKHRKAQGLPNIVLDLMSPGGTLRDLDIDSGFAVTLGDRRSDTIKKADERKGIDVIEADILTKRCWKEIREWLDEKHVKGFSLILCRPLMGATIIPKDLDLAYFLLNQAWMLLDTGGMFLTETRYFEDNVIGEYTQILVSNGIDSKMSPRAESGELHQGALRLLKSSTSPDILPKLP